MKPIVGFNRMTSAQAIPEDGRRFSGKTPRAAKRRTA